MNPRNHLRHIPRALALGVSVALLAACAGGPSKSPQLVRLENELSRLETDPNVAGFAAQELNEARNAVDLIAREGRRMDSELFDHNIYIADRLLQIAEAEGYADAAQQRAADLTQQRETLVAQARTAEADRARYAAEQARAQAEAAQAAAQAERLHATLAREEADAARAELMAMRQMLSDLQAKQTERGLVVTLGDVLFETDRAELKPGAKLNLDKLVNALREHPETTVAIEGHTDSTGTSDYNESLSSRRAESVRGYLAAQGIDSSRLTSRGLGEDFPVATNDSASGRQQNRRVEIVIQNADQRLSDIR